MPPTHRGAAGAAALAVCLALAGCSNGPKHVPPTTPLAKQCDTVPDGARRVVVPTTDGVSLGAALVGDPASPEGVVINYGASQTLCDWLDVAGRLSGDGAQVLVLDRRGRGSSSGEENLLYAASDVAAAANWLTAHGVRRTMLLGSSLGTVGAFIAAGPTGPRAAVAPPQPHATVLRRPPCGVMLVSPIVGLADHGGTISSLDTAGPLRARYWFGYETGNPVIANDAARLQDLVRQRGGTVAGTVAVDTKDHSHQLVDNHPEVPALLDRAVRSCA